MRGAKIQCDVLRPGGVIADHIGHLDLEQLVAFFKPRCKPGIRIVLGHCGGETIPTTFLVCVRNTSIVGGVARGQGVPSHAHLRLGPSCFIHGKGHDNFIKPLLGTEPFAYHMQICNLGWQRIYRQHRVEHHLARFFGILQRSYFHLAGIAHGIHQGDCGHRQLKLCLTGRGVSVFPAKIGS